MYFKYHLNTFGKLSFEMECIYHIFTLLRVFFFFAADRLYFVDFLEYSDYILPNNHLEEYIGKYFCIKVVITIFLLNSTINCG